MCGIAGIITKDSVFGAEVLPQMLSRIATRGPDGFGTQSLTSGEWSVNLGHRRLSIIDIETGKQPLSDTGGKGWITFNGEIYNYKELKRNLEKKRIRFQTLSDTEVLLQSYLCEGLDFLPHLKGMFAFAIWDVKKEQLLLARDRAGIKPLYYTEIEEGALAFASEMKALLAINRISKSIDMRSLSSYFFSDYIASPDSLLTGIKKVPPGHYLIWKKDQGVEVVPYWKLNSAPGISNLNEGQLIEELDKKLDLAMKRHLIADVPVGLFLSGGVDSSLVAALAQRQSSQPLKSFHIAFKEKEYDESDYAKAVSDFIGTEHIQKTLSVSNLLEVFDEALSYLDEPMADH
jgi:asparagine synthase (glutamine-hydrolysing)